MTAEDFVNLIEELMDLKVQQHAETHMKATSDVARLLAEKRETDRRRILQIKAELVRMLNR